MKKRSRAFNKEHLRWARENSTRTQDDVAVAIGIDQSQYARYENGDSEPSPFVIVALARELNVTADYLLGIVDDPAVHLREGDLSPSERTLLAAFRRGDLRGVMEIVVKKSQPEH